MNRFGYIDQRQAGNTKILLATFFIGFSGFLPFHKHMVEINGNMHLREVDEREGEDDFIPQSNSSHLSLTFAQYWTNLFKFIEAPYVKYLYNLVSFSFHQFFPRCLSIESIPM